MAKKATKKKKAVKKKGKASSKKKDAGKNKSPVKKAKKSSARKKAGTKKKAKKSSARKKAGTKKKAKKSSSKKKTKRNVTGGMRKGASKSASHPQEASGLAIDIETSAAAIKDSLSEAGDYLKEKVREGFEKVSQAFGTEKDAGTP